MRHAYDHRENKVDIIELSSTNRRTNTEAFVAFSKRS